MRQMAVKLRSQRASAQPQAAPLNSEKLPPAQNSRGEAYLHQNAGLSASRSQEAEPAPQLTQSCTHP
jgi:hypothetical protein